VGVVVQRVQFHGSAPDAGRLAAAVTSLCGLSASARASSAEVKSLGRSRGGLMSQDERRGPLSQVVVTVVVTLLVGGAAPWWWPEVRQLFLSQKTARPTPSSPPPRLPGGIRHEDQRTAQTGFEAVQTLYNKHKSTDNCAEISRIVADISAYAGNQQPVPEDARYSVRFPSIKPNPTIGDLVTDRITRIKSVKAQCFP